MIKIILIYAFIILLFIGSYVYTFRYQQEVKYSCSKKEHPLFFLYTLSLFIYDKLKSRSQIINQKTREALESLNFDRDKDTYLKLYWCKKSSLVMAILLIITIFSFIYEIQAMNQGELLHGDSIRRPSYGEGNKEVRFNVKVEEDDHPIEGEIDITVDERRYDKDLRIKKLENAKDYIDKHILGKNKSLDNVRYSLNLIKRIPDTSIVIHWQLDHSNLINSNGHINNNNISEEGELVEIIANISYYEASIEYPIVVHVKPKIISEKDQIINKLKKAIIVKSNETLTDVIQTLPKMIDGKKVQYSEQKERRSEKIFLIGILIAGLMYIMMDKDITDRYKHRETEILIDYPEIMNKVILLLGAGMTMKNAWGKIAQEYSKKRDQGDKQVRYAYEEMLITYHELNNGVIETKAYENYGKRMKLLPYLRFSSLISQNLKKGSKGLLELLEYETVDAFNERKELAKRLGEEASTKLLVPMIIMLLIVLAIIMIPAFIGL